MRGWSSLSLEIRASSVAFWLLFLRLPGEIARAVNGHPDRGRGGGVANKLIRALLRQRAQRMAERALAANSASVAMPAFKKQVSSSQSPFRFNF